MSIFSLCLITYYKNNVSNKLHKKIISMFVQKVFFSLTPVRQLFMKLYTAKITSHACTNAHNSATAI